MNFFTRLFKIGQAETNSILNHLEEPINLTEESINDLKAELKKSLEVIAEIKALSIHAKNEAEKFENKSTDYERKAIFILQKGQQKALSLLEADKLATEALPRLRAYFFYKSYDFFVNEALNAFMKLEAYTKSTTS